jgi:hypothetical protein
MCFKIQRIGQKFLLSCSFRQRVDSRNQHGSISASGFERAKMIWPGRTEAHLADDGRGQRASDSLRRIEERGERDNRCAVLVIVQYRNR